MSVYDDSSFKVSIHSNPKPNISISNFSNVKQLFDNMKKYSSLVIAYLDLAINECAGKNMQLTSQKEKITNLTNLAKKYNKESIHLEQNNNDRLNTMSNYDYYKQEQISQTSTAFKQIQLN